MRFTSGLGILFAVALVIPAQPQSVNMEHPPEIRAQRVTTPDDVLARTRNAQLQKDAKELSDLCASIPADMEVIKRGMMQKDLPDKLKHVEKLSKRLREELTR